MLTTPLPDLDPYIDAIMVIAGLVACILIARSLRHTRDTEDLGLPPELSDLPPTDCPWNLVGRHPNGKVWMYICTECEGMGPSADNLAPRRCADFHGHLRTAKGIAVAQRPR